MIGSPMHPGGKFKLSSASLLLNNMYTNNNESPTKNNVNNSITYAIFVFNSIQSFVISINKNILKFKVV